MVTIQKDKELLNKGYMTVYNMAKEFGRNRCSIETVLKYLYIELFKIVGKHLFSFRNSKHFYKTFFTFNNKTKR